MFYKQTPEKKKREMDWQLVAKYFTVKSTDCFYSADTKIAEFANHVDLDEVAHNEPSHHYEPHHLDPHCLPSSLCILNMIKLGLNIF